MGWGKGSLLSTVHVQGTECPSGERPLVWDLLPSLNAFLSLQIKLLGVSLLKCFSRQWEEHVGKNQSMPMKLCWSSRVYWCIENTGNSVWLCLTLTNNPPIWGWLGINLWKWWVFSVVLSELYWSVLVYFSSPSDDFITQQLHTHWSGSSAEAQDEDWGSAGSSLRSCSAWSGWRRAEQNLPWSTGVSVRTHGLSTAGSTLPQIPKEKLGGCGKPL